MPARRPENTIQASANATQATAGAASGTTAIPTMSTGTKARRVALKVVTATEVMYFRPVQAGGTVTAGNGYPLQATDGWLVVAVAGFSHIAAIRNAAADVLFNIVPLED